LLRGIFRTKNLDDILASAQEEGHKLKRTLGPINITLLGIGAIISAGILAPSARLRRETLRVRERDHR